jgi:hypothetical protein
MKLIFPLILISFHYSYSIAQNIQQYYSLDTIINFSYEQIPVQNIRRSTQLTASKKNVYLAFDIKNKADTQIILKVNQSNYSIKKIKYKLPDIVLKNWIKNISAFTQIGDSLFALSFHKTLLVYKMSLQSNTLDFVSYIELNASPKYIKLTSNYLFACDIYKRDAKHPSNNATIVKYDAKNDYKFLKKHEIDFDHVEFAYFFPNHWIDINENVILVSNTSSYKINVYNHEFKKLSTFEKFPKEWVSMDSEILKRLNKKIPITEPVVMIDSLATYNDKIINRITDVQGVNDSIYFICWYDYDSTSKRSIRYVDFFKLNNNQLINIESNIADKFYHRMDSAIASKNDYPLMFWNYNSYIGDNRIIVFREYAPIQYTNRPWYIITKELNSYYEKNNPMPSIFIYKFN